MYLILKLSRKMLIEHVQQDDMTPMRTCTCSVVNPLLMPLVPRTPTPAYLRFPITYGTSIPGFTSGGCTHTKPKHGGFSLAPKRPPAVSLHNTRMEKRRRLNAYYNRRYGTNTHISSDTWFLRQSYMSQPTMWLRDQIFNDNGDSICW